MRAYHILILLLILSACKKNKFDDTAAAAHITVPAYSETGAGTFGCYVNGVAWSNFGQQYISGLYSNQPGHYVANTVQSIFTMHDQQDSILYFTAQLTVQHSGAVIRNETMYMTLLKTKNLKGAYLFGQNSAYIFGYRNNLNGSLDYYSQPFSPFQVIINKDSVSGGIRIISGRFSGTVYRIPINGVLQKDSLKISGGVFDAGIKLP